MSFSILGIQADLFRMLTGRLFTDAEIRQITAGAVGKYLTEFFPTPQDELEAQGKVEAARHHIERASAIVSQLKTDLDSQSDHLERLLVEIGERKEEAQRYRLLAESSEASVQAVRAEIEVALRRQLEAQSSEGRRRRQLGSLVIWSLTLVLGVYLPDLISLLAGLLGKI